MFSFIKDLIIFLFSATEVIEKTADQFRKTRKNRYKEFDHKIKEEEGTKEKQDFNDFFYKGKEQLQEFSKKAGIATQDDIDEIKYKIEDLQKKLERLLDEKEKK